MMEEVLSPRNIKNSLSWGDIPIANPIDDVSDLNS